MNEINEQIDVILENQTIDVIQIKNSIRTILVKQKQREHQWDAERDEIPYGDKR